MSETEERRRERREEGRGMEGGEEGGYRNVFSGSKSTVS